jgi:hypothetical protein
MDADVCALASTLKVYAVDVLLASIVVDASALRQNILMLLYLEMLKCRLYPQNFYKIINFL